MEKQIELLDKIALSVLPELIAKMPFYDTKGEFGVKVSEEDLQNIKKGLTATAYEYASWMLIAREGSKQWLKDNVDKNKDFGL